MQFEEQIWEMNWDRVVKASNSLFTLYIESHRAGFVLRINKADSIIISHTQNRSQVRWSSRDFYHILNRSNQDSTANIRHKTRSHNNFKDVHKLLCKWDPQTKSHNCPSNLSRSKFILYYAVSFSNLLFYSQFQKAIQYIGIDRMYYTIK